MLAEVCSMQLYCLRLGRLIEEGRLTDTIAALAKMDNTRKARQVVAEARDLLGGNGILLDFHVMRHMADMEALHTYTYEGTETIQSSSWARTSRVSAPLPESAPSIRYVDVDGVRLRTSVRGAGSPLLLLTGIGAPLELSAPLERALNGHGVQPIALDARVPASPPDIAGRGGCPASPAPSSGPSTLWVTTGWTCSGCRSAACSASNSRTRRRNASAGWSWPRPGQAWPSSTESAVSAAGREVSAATTSRAPESRR
jgi:hypothetical protein